MAWLDVEIQTNSVFGSSQTTVQSGSSTSTDTVRGSSTRTTTQEAPSKTITSTKVSSAHTVNSTKTQEAVTNTQNEGSHYGYTVAFSVPYHPGQKTPILPGAPTVDC